MGREVYFPPEMLEYALWFDEWVLGRDFPHLVELNPRTHSVRKWDCFVTWTALWSRIPIMIEQEKAKRGI